MLGRNILRKVSLILFTVSFIVFSKESCGRLTTNESVQLVEDAVKAGYVTPETGEKLKAYFLNPEKRKELGSILSQVVLYSRKTERQGQANEELKKIENVLGIAVDEDLNRLRYLSTLLLPCWTGTVTVSRIAPTGQSFNWVILASSSPHEDDLTVINGWQESDIKRWLAVAQYANGKGTDLMLNGSLNLSKSQLERCIRLIAYSEMEDSVPTWEKDVITKFGDISPLESLAMFSEPVLTNTCQPLTTTSWGGNCLYTTLRHLILILTSNFGMDNKASVFAKMVPNSAPFCAYSLGRLLILNDNNFIRTWDDFCKSKGIDHFPTLQGIASGLAKLANKSPISCTNPDAIKQAIVESSSQLSSQKQDDIICNIISIDDFPQKPKWITGLLILGSRSHDICLCIGFSDIDNVTKAPTACHTEIIGIWKSINSLPANSTLPTTYYNMQIPLSKIGAGTTLNTGK